MLLKLNPNAEGAFQTFLLSKRVNIDPSISREYARVHTKCS